MNEDVKVDLIRFADDLSDKFSKEKVVQTLIKPVQYLIENDFPKLVDVLYRADINEKKLKDNLSESSPTDAAVVIASMLYERLHEKKIFRQNFKFPSSDISEEDRW